MCVYIYIYTCIICLHTYTHIFGSSKWRLFDGVELKRDGSQYNIRVVVAGVVVSKALALTGFVH